MSGPGARAEEGPAPTDVRAPDSDTPPVMNPAVRRGRRPGPDGPLGFVWDSTVMGWRWLVRMRTALYLLALLGVETLIATLIPQEPNVPTTVAAWREGAEGPGAGAAALFDTFGLFDLYGSTLFLATLFLLFLSLTACMIPRVRAWVRLVRRSVPPVTRAPDRQQLVAHLATDTPPDRVHAAARELLGRRWRLRPAELDAGAAPQVAAERGLWSREGGSLLFHLSFYVLLSAVVYGQLAGFTGQVGVVEGEPGFSDAPALYWNQEPGRFWQADDHAGWTLDLDAFEVDWVRDPLAPGAGQPTTFASDVTVTSADGTVTTDRIEGNAPVTFEGMKVTQLDWGYAPRLQVEVDGELLYDDLVIAPVNQETTLPHFRSAVKVPGVDPREVGLDIFLYPFAPDGDDGQPQLTGAPWDEAPVIVMVDYRGDLQLGATPQSVSRLETSGMERSGGAFLRPGAEVELLGDEDAVPADAEVTVRFVELRRWVGFQVSNRPQITGLLVASGMLLGGLWTALYAYRRRLWVVATTDPDQGRTLVTVAGRAFQRPDAFVAEHEQLVADLATAIGAEPATGPTDGPSTGPGDGPHAPGDPTPDRDPDLAGSPSR